MLDRADLARDHHLARLLQLRDIAIGQVDHVDDPCPFGSFRHLERLVIILRERLLAKNVLAGGKQRQGRRIVSLVRRDIRHRIELAPGQRLVQRREALLDIERIAKGREPRRIRVDGADDLDARNASEMLHMVLRHAARANYY